MYTLYDYLFFFSVYAFLGWCAEVCFCSINTGKFVNRGFLNGPVCPIYGFGMVIVIFCLTPIQENIFLLFGGAFVLTTLLEGITGWRLKKLFHTTWWDYSEMPFNIGGYVCLAFSIMWGIGGCFVMRLIHPLIHAGIAKINHKFGIVILRLIFTAFACDCISTLMTILNLNKDLGALGLLAEKLHEGSENLARHIGDTAIESSEKYESSKLDLQARIDIAKAEILDRRSFGRARILRAFPNMKSERFNDALKELKAKYIK